MRVLIEPSDYELRNLGDAAMPQATVARVKRLRPKATIDILTDHSNLWPIYRYHVHPLGVQGRRIWFKPFLFSSHLPNSMRSRVYALERYLRCHRQSLVESILRARLSRHSRSRRQLDDYLNAVSAADLVIVSGMGGITDAFPDFAESLLDSLEFCIQHRRSTVMVGQGIGPLRNPHLRARTQVVLPQLDFIGLREDLFGGPLLRSLGVHPARMMTTGDDAIDVAYHARADGLGIHFGVNLRAASYAGIDRALARHVGSVIRNAAIHYQAEIVPLPISWVPGEEDSKTLNTFIVGNHLSANTDLNEESLPALLHQVSLCRIVVTGSYHAAVFALSQGIPAVGITNSEYYFCKLSGLAKQFGGNCEVVRLADSDVATSLRSAIARAWTSAEEQRPKLLASARRQIALSHAAYERIFEMVDSRKRREFDVERT